MEAIVKTFLKFISVIIPINQKILSDDHTYPEFQILPLIDYYHLFLFFYGYEVQY